MEAGKQQVKLIAEIQAAFRDLDIGQLVQGKTLTVGLAVNSCPSC